ncbi:MAG: DUF4293 domain-containing protein [Taibaiella sp.]|nr:DUF4293 domain-containing protein [Taibaiella sp.]
MIQRLQSVWMLLAALLCACLFLVDFYSFHSMVNGVDTVSHVRINDFYPGLLLALVVILLPLVAIFMYSNRKRQITMLVMNLLVLIGFVSLMFMHVNNMTTTMAPVTNGNYGAGAIIPVVCIILMIMALRGVRKDEKLVRSQDRLR